MPDLKAYYSFRHTLDYLVARLTNRTAWIDYHKGQHELYVQDFPQGERRRLLTSEGDDGQPLRMLAMSGSGRYLLLTRGEFSEQLPCLNPRQSVVPPKGCVQVIDLDSGAITVSLGAFTTAALHPAENAVLWATEGTAYIQYFNETTPRILFSVRGQILSLHHAPNGQHLAFVCQRQKRTLLGLFTVGSSRIRWISPGFDRDTNPCWSPDSTRLAFLRFHGPEPDIAHLHFSHKADSFAIICADLAHDIIQPLWESGTEELCGLSQQSGHRPLSWLDNNRLLFSHDNCGWDHIYLLTLALYKSTNNDQPSLISQGTALTEGAWLVHDYTTCPNGKLMAYSHNRHNRARYSMDVLNLAVNETIETMAVLNSKKVDVLNSAATEDAEESMAVPDLMAVPNSSVAADSDETMAVPNLSTQAEALSGCPESSESSRQSVAVLNPALNPAADSGHKTMGVLNIGGGKSMDVLNSGTEKSMDVPDSPDSKSMGVLNLESLRDDHQYWRPTLSHDGQFLLFIASSHSEPCYLAYMALPDSAQSIHAAVQLTKPNNHATLPSHYFQQPRQTIIKSRDAQAMHGQVFHPKGDGPFPAVINIHGGPWLQSLPGFHHHLGMSFQYALCQLLAECGYLVLDINYRGSSGFGKLFRQAQERGWDGASDYLDVQAAGQWLSRQSCVDRTRIGVIGESWGGYLAAMALARDSGLFRAGVVINGCHSFPRELRQSHWGSTLFDCVAGEEATESIARAKIAEESSPWGWLDQWMSPVLLVHGDDDQVVSFEESQHLAHALQQRAVDVESLALPGEGHRFLLHDSWLQIGQQTLVFLNKHLRTY